MERIIILPPELGGAAYSPDADIIGKLRETTSLLQAQTPLKHRLVRALDNLTSDFETVIRLQADSASTDQKRTLPRAPGPAMTDVADIPNIEWTDLGLESGKLWSVITEILHDYTSATMLYPDLLPTRKDYEDLFSECEAQWDDKRKGIEVLGRNGNALFIPACGWQAPKEAEPSEANATGYYWISGRTGSFAQLLTFYPYKLHYTKIGVYIRCGVCLSKPAAGVVSADAGNGRRETTPHEI